MNFVNHAEGSIFSIQSALRSSEEKQLQTSQKLFKLAMVKFNEAVSATPDNKEILSDYAEQLIQVTL